MASRWDMAGPAERVLIVAMPLVFLGSAAAAMVADKLFFQLSFMAMLYASGGVMFWLITRKREGDKS